ARFDAQIEILEGGSSYPPGTSKIFPAYWERAKGPQTEIAEGLQDRIYLGSSESGHGGVNVLRVYYTDPVTGGVGATTETVGGGKRTPGKIRVTVTISPVPAMKDGPFVRTYSLTPTNLIEAPR